MLIFQQSYGRLGAREKTEKMCNFVLWIRSYDTKGYWIAGIIMARIALLIMSIPYFGITKEDGQMENMKAGTAKNENLKV